MPKLPKHIERACWTCKSYEIKTPEGPFCNHFKKLFPNPTGWANGDGSKKPGLRVCKNWVAK